MQSHSDIALTRRPGALHLAPTLLLALLACQSATAGGVPKETFPRLGGYQIGATPFEGYQDPEYHEQIAKLDFAIIGSTLTLTNDTAVSIRSMNPDIVLLKYTSLMEVSTRAQGNYTVIKRNKVSAERGPNSTNAHDWWARDPSGNNVSNWPNNWTVNITRYVRPDANGDRYSQWAAKLDHQHWLRHEVWDGVFQDTVFWQPRGGAADADLSGGTESNSARVKAAFRQGNQDYWNELKRLEPDQIITVNHDWYRSESPTAQGPLQLPEYHMQVHGGLLEIVMRSSDLLDRPRTLWNDTMRHYRRSMEYFRQPNMTMFIVKGEPDNWRFLRYSLATCLMQDGYFEYVPDDNYQYGTVEWFDEFDLAGTAGTDWLGRAIDPPQDEPWRSGVWRRDFEGGLALVNPQGNGVRTITIEEGFRHIPGRSETQVNNGQPAGQITLQDGDGILLVREGVVRAPATPKPPVLLE